MDKNEVIITLSSDDETETAKAEVKTVAEVKPNCALFPEVKKYAGVIVKNNKDGGEEKKGHKKLKGSNGSPEVVDLEEVFDKLDEGLLSENDQEAKQVDTKTSSNSSCKENQKLQEAEKVTTDLSHRNVTEKTNKECNQNLQFFTEFVEYCGSLEKVPNDRIRLTRKLMKRYGEADSVYIKSPEFRSLIEKCRERVNENNLYLIAKDITEELSFKKKVALDEDKSNEENQKIANSQEEAPTKLTKKRARFINKVVKKLDKLGSKIKELEEKEVDLSDEEDSVYVTLQRYRDRFCQIYKRLCAYTNQVPDPNNRRICFTESRYPAINKCIENWLNKTKRFPDFTDIMKLLESQSSSLGLPSNRDAIRTIAEEIFQKVGVMLQRRRVYDLWDILCGFLDDGKDPADSDPSLDQTLKKNFETRLKKEQEIFQHFSELQEKEKLEPEEVGDEEANQSVDSGNEDDKEIEEFENGLIKRADDAIKGEGSKECSENGDNSENEPDPTSSIPEKTVACKETKNNYRNCKSLKWRQENSGKSKSDTNSEDSSAGAENEKEKIVNKSEVEKNHLELITVKDMGGSEEKTGLKSGTICKRVSKIEIESPKKKKKKFTTGSDFDLFDIDDENEKTKEVFGVHCCQIFPDNILMDFEEEKKDWGKRRVFRDLTNVSRLMELHGKRKKMSGLFSPSFFHQSFYKFEKTSWKKRFKVSFQMVGAKSKKCALSHGEKSAKTVNSSSRGGSNEKNFNSKGGGDNDGDNFYNSHGNGNEEDDNEDENKKSRRTKFNENQYEDDEEEEEEEEPEEISKQKTEADEDNETHSENPRGEKNKSGNSKAKKVIYVELEDEKDEETRVDTEVDIVIEEVKSFPNKKLPGKTRTTDNSKTVAVKNKFPKKIEEKKPSRKSTSSPSDEERVKRFLMHSPSSISITLPKKRTKASQPSPAALQALETLRHLKGISATIVRSEPDPEDDVVVIENFPISHASENSSSKGKKTVLPVISSVQSMAPDWKLLNCQGSEEPVLGNRDVESGTSSIKILSVWGSTPAVYTPAPKANSRCPGCSSSSKGNSKKRKKRRKNSKKAVDCVVLE